MINENIINKDFTKLGDYVELKAVTWSKDSHGLFDYESKNIDIKKFKTTTSTCIYRQGDNISILPANAEFINEQNLENYASLNIEKDFDNKYSISSNNKHPNNEIFLIIRSLKNKEGLQRGYNLVPGDLLKVGRVEFKVLEVKGENGVQLSNDYGFIEKNCKNQEMLSQNAKSQCRICWDEELNNENCRFIDICKCKGSCGYIHLKCLQDWVVRKITTRQSSTVKSYCFLQKKFECEVCKENLPYRISINGEQIDILDIERPDCPYIILENISREKKTSKAIHILKFPGEESIKLGRGHACELRISDISVSRMHAFIRYEKGQFLVTDNNSKFGTLILLNDKYPISSKKAAIQIGRTVITFVQKFSTPINLGSPRQLHQYNNNNNNRFDGFNNLKLEDYMMSLEQQNDSPLQISEQILDKDTIINSEKDFNCDNIMQEENEQIEIENNNNNNFDDN